MTGEFQIAQVSDFIPEGTVMIRDVPVDGAAPEIEGNDLLDQLARAEALRKAQMKLMNMVKNMAANRTVSMMWMMTYWKVVSQL